MNGIKKRVAVDMLFLLDLLACRWCKERPKIRDCYTSCQFCADADGSAWEMERWAL